jgi:very-short-patch-repair endonuclease
MVAMSHGVITMEQALAAGVSRRRVFRMVERGDWLQLHSGIYLPDRDLNTLSGSTGAGKRRQTKRGKGRETVDGIAEAMSPTGAVSKANDNNTNSSNIADGLEPSSSEEIERRWAAAKERVGEEPFWKARLAGQLLFGGDGSMVSHRAAAKLHGLEGISGFPIDVTVPSMATRRPPGCHRSKIVDSETVMIAGLRVSSLVRTLQDLAMVCTLDVLEQALESALRGPDRRRPDVWNTALLSALRVSLESNSQRAGNFLLRTVLNRRADADRPTGSFPETLLWQALFRIGLVAVRQPSLAIFDGSGCKLETFFPDLSLPRFRILIEVDGAVGHTGEVARSRDLSRQNKLLRGFVILRFTAVDILRDANAAAEEIRRATLGADALLEGWTHGGVTVKYSANCFTVVDQTRNR